MPRRIRRLWLPANATGAVLVAIYVAKTGVRNRSAIARALGMSRRHVVRLWKNLPPAPAYDPTWVPIDATILARTDLTMAAKILATGALRYGTGATGRIRGRLAKQRARRARRALDRVSFNTPAKAGGVRQSERPPLCQSEPSCRVHPLALECTVPHPETRGRAKTRGMDGWGAALSTEWRNTIAGGMNADSLTRLFALLGLFERSEAARAAFAARMAASYSVEHVLAFVQVLQHPPAKLGRIRSKAGTLRAWLERGTGPKDVAPLAVGKQLRRQIASQQRKAAADEARRVTESERLAAVLSILERAQVRTTPTDVAGVIARMRLAPDVERAASMFVGDHGAREPLAALATWCAGAGRSAELFAALPENLRAAITAAMLPT